MASEPEAEPVGPRRPTSGTTAPLAASATATSSRSAAAVPLHSALATNASPAVSSPVVETGADSMASGSSSSVDVSEAAEGSRLAPGGAPTTVSALPPLPVASRSFRTPTDRSLAGETEATPSPLTLLDFLQTIQLG
jgi:hypothetical protein